MPPGRGAGPLCPCGQCRRQPASATPAEPVVDTGDLTAGEVQQWIALLQNVLETELYAAKYYEVAARALDGYPRFRNLAGAEQRHAEAISWAIRTLGGTPAPAQRAKITPPRSIAEADAHCQKIEKRVIEVFDAMIASAPTDSLSTIFQNIQRANRRHLSAVGGPSSRSVSTVGD